MIFVELENVSIGGHATQQVKTKQTNITPTTTVTHESNSPEIMCASVCLFVWLLVDWMSLLRTVKNGHHAAASIEAPAVILGLDDVIFATLYLDSTEDYRLV